MMNEFRNPGMPSPTSPWLVPRPDGPKERPASPVIRIKSNVIVEAWCPHSGDDSAGWPTLENAERVSRKTVGNMVVNAGLNLVRDLLGGVALRPDKIAVGTGTTATVAGDTALGTETFRKLMARRIDAAQEITFQMLMETTEGNGVTVWEIGTFQNETMLARAVLSTGQVKNSGIQLTIAHQFTLADA